VVCGEIIKIDKIGVCLNGRVRGQDDGDNNEMKQNLTAQANTIKLHVYIYIYNYAEFLFNTQL